MSERQVQVVPPPSPSRWRVLGPLAALTVVAALLSLVLLFFHIIGWAFSRRGTPVEEFWSVSGLLLLGVGPAVVMLVLSLQRRPRRSTGGAVLAGIVALLVGSFFAQPLAETAIDYGDRLQRESRPLLPEETAFSVEEATAAAEAERAAAIDFLAITPDYQWESTRACALSTGIPGTTPYVTADLSLSDWPKDTVGTVPGTLREHWAGLGYDVTVSELSEGRVAVDFVADGEPALTGRALWEPGSLRFGLRVDGPCLRD